MQEPHPPSCILIAVSSHVWVVILHPIWPSSSCRELVSSRVGLEPTTARFLCCFDQLFLHHLQQRVRMWQIEYWRWHNRLSRQRDQQRHQPFRSRPRRLSNKFRLGQASQQLNQWKDARWSRLQKLRCYLRNITLLFIKKRYVVSERLLCCFFKIVDEMSVVERQTP